MYFLLAQLISFSMRVIERRLQHGIAQGRM
jgi:hypothetical protein